jgi:hypothetical protein
MRSLFTRLLVLAALSLQFFAPSSQAQSYINGFPAALGQTTMANSLPVVFPNNQSALPVSGTVAVTGVATETTVAAINGKTPALGQAAMAASQPVAIATDQSSIPVNQAGVSATGSITALNSNLSTGAATANSAVALSLNGATGFAIDLRGTFTQTLLVQGSVTGADWITLQVIPIGAGLNVAQVASVSGPGAWWGNASGLQQIRVTCSAFTSGTATPVLRAMQAAGVVFNVPAGQTSQSIFGTVTAGASTNLVGDIGHQARATTGGISAATSINRLVSAAATTNGTVVKASAGRVYKITGQNNSATVKYLKFTNLTAITVGTSAVVFTLVLPPNTVNGGVFEFNLGDYGVFFGTGICYGITGGAADADTTALAAGDIQHLNVFFL